MLCDRGQQVHVNWERSSSVPVRVPEGLKSSPSRVTHRVRTSLWNASDFAVVASWPMQQKKIVKKCICNIADPPSSFEHQACNLHVLKLWHEALVCLLRSAQPLIMAHRAQCDMPLIDSMHKNLHGFAVGMEHRAKSACVQPVKCTQICIILCRKRSRTLQTNALPKAYFMAAPRSASKPTSSSAMVARPRPILAAAACTAGDATRALTCAVTHC